MKITESQYAPKLILPDFSEADLYAPSGNLFDTHLIPDDVEEFDFLGIKSINRQGLYYSYVRFWEHVEPDDNGCWIWNGNPDVYGRWKSPYWSPDTFTHRIAYRMLRGSFAAPPARRDPDAELTLECHHVCLVEGCQNAVEHLEEVTHKVNLARDNTRVKFKPLAAVCPQGHPYSGENLYVNPKGKRSCRQCTRESLLRSYYKHHEKRKSERARYR